MRDLVLDRPKSQVFTLTESDALVSFEGCRSGHFFWGFRILSVFYRFFGVNFLRDLNSVTTVAFSYHKSLSLIFYALLLWFLGGVFAVNAILLQPKVPDVNYVDKLSDVYFYVHAGYLVNCLVTFGIFNYVKSKDEVKLARTCLKLETNLQMGKKYSIVMRSVAVILLLFNIYIILNSILYTVNKKEATRLSILIGYRGLDTIWDILGRIGEVISSPAATAVEMWIVYYATFFSFCYGCLCTLLNSLIQDGQRMSVSEVERLHKLFLFTTDSVMVLDRIYSVRILIVFASNFVFCCFTMCLAVLQNDAELSVLFTQAFFVSLFRITVPTIFSGYMSAMGKDIQNIVQRALIDQRTMEEEATLLKFRQTVYVSNINFTGSGFFTVDFPLIVWVISSIITYGVILIQGK